MVNKRLDACALPGRKARNPIEPGLLARIHEASGGSLRETFIICSKLCLAIAGDPMYEAITEAEACTLLAELIHRNKQGREVKYRTMAEISLAAGSL